MRDSEKIIINMVLGLKHGQMERNMKDSIFMVKNMVKEFIYGMMVPHMMVIGIKITLLDMVYTLG